MPLERIIPGIAMGATLFGTAFVVLAQAAFDPFATAAERIIGGSMIVVAAVFIVRATLRLFREARSFASDDRAAALAREQLLIDQLGQTASQIAQLNAQLNAERALRLSLEARGVTDRRSSIREEE